MDPLYVLGLKLGASQEEVRRAFRKAALRTHPDRGGSQAAFVEACDAYKALTAKEHPVQAQPTPAPPPHREPAPVRQTEPKKAPWEAAPPGPPPRPPPRPTYGMQTVDHTQIYHDVAEAGSPMRQDSLGIPY